MLVVKGKKRKLWVSSWLMLREWQREIRTLATLLGFSLLSLKDHVQLDLSSTIDKSGEWQLKVVKEMVREYPAMMNTFKFPGLDKLHPEVLKGTPFCELETL